MLLYHRLECTHFPLEFLDGAVQQPPLVLDVVLHGLELLLLTSLLLEPLLQLFVFAAQLGQVPLEDERSIRVRRSNSWYGSTCVLMLPTSPARPATGWSALGWRETSPLLAP